MEDRWALARTQGQLLSIEESVGEAQFTSLTRESSFSLGDLSVTMLVPCTQQAGRAPGLCVSMGGILESPEICRPFGHWVSSGNRTRPILNTGVSPLFQRGE